MQAAALPPAEELLLADILKDMKEGGRGAHGKDHSGIQGRSRGAYLWDGQGRLSGRWAELDTAATLRAASPKQIARRESLSGKNLQNALCILPEDYRLKLRTGKTRAGILFVVDASRSQGADRRLSFAKGAVLSLLSQAYCTRDEVGLIAFGNGRADVLLPLTRSVEYAAKHLNSLPAAGNTPIAMGLRKALEVFTLEKKRSGSFRPFLILLTDGKANYDILPGDPFSRAVEAAVRIKEAQIPALVIDTERGYFSMGLAGKLSEAMGGAYKKLFDKSPHIR